MNGRIHTPALASRLLLLTATGLALVTLFEVALRHGWIPNARYDRERYATVAVDGPFLTLLVLGDSFIVPDGMLGRALAEAWSAERIAVVNRATSGTGPFEYAEELRQHVDDVRPDLVLLSWYAGNDLTNVRDHPLHRGGGRGQTGVGIDRTASLPILRHLHAFHFLRSRVALWRATRLDDAALCRSGFDPELLADARALRINPYLVQLALHDRDHFLANLLVRGTENLAAWDEARALLIGIQDRSAAAGAELRIVIFPHSMQVDGSRFDFLRRLTFRVDEASLETARPQELMAAFCAERGIPLLDLLPLFRAHAGTPLYLEKDDHLAAAGNHIAARQIRAFVGER